MTKIDHKSSRHGDQRTCSGGAGSLENAASLDSTVCYSVQCSSQQPVLLLAFQCDPLLISLPHQNKA